MINDNISLNTFTSYFIFSLNSWKYSFIKKCQTKSAFLTISYMSKPDRPKMRNAYTYKILIALYIVSNQVIVFEI